MAILALVPSLARWLPVVEGAGQRRRQRFFAGSLRRLVALPCDLLRWRPAAPSSPPSKLSAR